MKNLSPSTKAIVGAAIIAIVSVVTGLAFTSCNNGTNSEKPNPGATITVNGISITYPAGMTTAQIDALRAMNLSGFTEYISSITIKNDGGFSYTFTGADGSEKAVIFTGKKEASDIIIELDDKDIINKVIAEREGSAVDPLDRTHDGIEFRSLGEGYDQSDMDDINAALNALVAGGQLAQFSDYVASWTVTTAETGNYINIATVGEPGQEKAAITVSNERALSILDDLTAGKTDAQEARLYIGTWGGIEVRVAPGVDRAHGQAAFDSLSSEQDVEGFMAFNNGRITVVEITGPAGLNEMDSFENGVVRGTLDSGTLSIFDLMSFAWSMAQIQQIGNTIYIVRGMDAQSVQHG